MSENHETNANESDLNTPQTSPKRRGGIIQVADDLGPKEDWEKEIEGDEETRGGDERKINGRPLLGGRHEGPDIERKTDGSETVRDVMIRTTAGKAWDPDKIYISPAQEKGRGPGQHIQCRINPEYAAVWTWILANFKEYNNEFPNFVRDAVLSRAVYLTHVGMYRNPLFEMLLFQEQEKTELEKHKLALKNVDEMLEALTKERDEEGFTRNVIRYREDAQEFPKLWKDRINQVIDRWEMKW